MEQVVAEKKGLKVACPFWVQSTQQVCSGALGWFLVFFTVDKQFLYQS
jgi:hypothetical protein